LLYWAGHASRGGAVFVVLAAACAACSVLTSFDGFSGGGTSAEGGTTDGAFDALVVDSSGGSLPDSSEPPPDDAGSRDSAAVETSSPADSSVDSAQATDADGSWCGSQPGPLLFCDDFDEGLLVSRFDTVDQKNCTVQRQSGLDVSPPNSMSAMTQGSMQTLYCGASKAFPGQGASGATYKLAFDLQPVQADYSANSDAVVAAIRLSDAAGTVWSLQVEPAWDTTNGALTVYLSEDTELPDGGEHYYQTIASTDLPLQMWTRVTLELTVGPQNVPQTAQLFFGTSMIAAANLHPSTTNPTASFFLGFSYVPANNVPWWMLYDNVTFSAN
jgi:hypothetical protein